MYTETIEDKKKYRRASNAKLQFDTFESKGQYKHLQMEYSATLNGDVDAIQIRCSGEAKINGNVIAKEIDLRGVSVINGDISGNSLNIVGESKITGNIKFENFKLDGKLEGSGDIECTNLISKGRYVGVNNAIADTIEASGELGIKNLKANKIILKISTNSNIKSIHGENVDIIATGGLISKFITSSNTIEIDTIEGKDLVLTNIKVKNVIGENITLNKKCIIDNLTYTKALDKGNSSVVNNVTKL